MARFRPKIAPVSSIRYLHLLTTVASGVLRSPASFVHRDLGVLADEALADIHTVLEVGNDELVGRLAAFLPLFDEASASKLKFSGPVVPGPWPMPGTMKNRIDSLTAFAPSLATTAL